jgi:hypothetical protein
LSAHAPSGRCVSACGQRVLSDRLLGVQDTRRGGAGGPCAARARGGKSKALHHLGCGVCVTRMPPYCLTPPK